MIKIKNFCKLLKIKLTKMLTLVGDIILKRVDMWPTRNCMSKEIDQTTKIKQFSYFENKKIKMIWNDSE